WKLYGNQKKILKFLLKTLPIFGLIFSLWYTSSLSSSLSLPKDVSSLFLTIPVLFPILYLGFLKKYRIFTRSSERFFLLTSIGMAVVSCVSILLGWIDFARLFIPPGSVLLCITYFIVSSRLVEKTPKLKEHKVLQRISSTSYHQIKSRLLRLFLFIFTISLVCVFILSPQWQIIPVAGIIGSIIFFTFESKKYVFYYQQKRRRKSRAQGYMAKKRAAYFEPKHARAAYLLLVFAIIYPLIFAVSSLVSISRPEMTYSKVPNLNRIENSVDLTNLEYYSSLEDIDSLSINDEFIIKSKISPSLGESALVRVRLVPIDVEPIEGFRIEQDYEISSGYVSGPKNNYDMITHVPLNTLNLAPGKYRVEVTYNVLTGFAYRSAPSETFEIFIGKDTLEVLSNERFSEPLEAGYQYGAVYGFEYETNGTKSWNIVYDGQIVDSLHNPIQLDNLLLYIEEYDRYTQIANVSTDNQGKFYFNHTV
ncbi:hypothetical protein LCGC14_2564450, partial [marine sediment metagenome]